MVLLHYHPRKNQIRVMNNFKNVNEEFPAVILLRKVPVKGQDVRYTWIDNRRVKYVTR